MALLDGISWFNSIAVYLHGSRQIMDVELANLSNMNLVRMHGVGVYMAAPLTHYTPQYKPEFDFVALFTPF